MSFDLARLRETAKETLRANDAGIFTRPGNQQYPHQWNWDSAVIALGLSHYDLPRALVELRALLGAQWKNGMLPHVVYHNAPSDYFPDSAFWQIESSPDAPLVPTSGITQPPLLTTVIRRIHNRTPIVSFVREVYPALLRWHRWLHTDRDDDGSGLVYLIHPWESGTDDSPRWLSAMEDIRPLDVPPFRRGDTRYVDAAERPYQADYERFINLIDIFRRHRYQSASLLTHSPFLVKDILFNAILFRANVDLRALAVELKEPVEEIDHWLACMRANFDRCFWDEGRGLYFDYNLRMAQPIRVNTAATFMPLYAGLSSPEQAHRLINEHWLNPKEYAYDQRTHYGITTTSKDEPAWDARRYWRGPVWIIQNWMLIDGLKMYGFDDLAQRLRQDSLALLDHSGFREYYDSHDGSGCGSTQFSWSAALLFELLEEDQ